MKAIVLGLAVSMTLFGTVGCGEDTEATDTTEETAGENTDATETTDETAEETTEETVDNDTVEMTEDDMAKIAAECDSQGRIMARSFVDEINRLAADDSAAVESSEDAVEETSVETEEAPVEEEKVAEEAAKRALEKKIAPEKLATKQKFAEKAAEKGEAAAAEPASRSILRGRRRSSHALA